MNFFAALDEYKKDLPPFIEKLEKGELTIEDILNEDSIIQDIKKNKESQFINFFTNDKIQKLIDYSTRFPISDEHNIGYKYPFYATDILCSENISFQNKFMSEKMEENSDINLVNKIQKRGGFLVKLFEAINHAKKNSNNNDKGNENEKEKDGNIYEEEYSDETDNDIDFKIIENDDINNNKNKKVIYENVDYLLGFLQQSNETKENYVLAGYFYKILNNLINVHSNKIIDYLFDYPNKDKLDILDLLVKNMYRKSMCNIIQKLLLFDDDFNINLEDQKMNLLEKIFKELDVTNDKNKYECICDSLSLIMGNKQLFDLFMKKPNLLELLYNIANNPNQNSNKIISLIKLLTKINDNILQNFESKITQNPQDYKTNNDLMLPINNNYYSPNKSSSSPEDSNTENLKNFLFSLFNIIEKNNFPFLNDLGNCAQEENVEFTSTYLEPQKKIGIKKIIQTEYIKTILDIFVNSFASGFYREKIEKIINIANNQNIFWNLHNLFFLFPFSNIYQIYYNQIMEIIINENSPNCLIELFFINKNENTKLIEMYINNLLNHFDFTFKLTNTHAFNPYFTFIISLLNKIFNTQKLYLKSIIENNKDLSIFYEIIVKEMYDILNQKLLLNNQEINVGEIEDEVLSSFGPKNFLELFEEDYKIYKAYKNGENYEIMLNAKKERKEKERLEKEKEREEKKKKKIESLNEDDSLFKIEKNNLLDEKDNFLALLNKPIEEVYKYQDNNTTNNNNNNTIDVDDDNKNKDNNKLDIKELEDDFEEKNNIIIDDKENEKINNENAKLNEDITPNSLDNKIYHVEYGGKMNENNTEEKQKDNDYNNDKNKIE